MSLSRRSPWLVVAVVALLATACGGSDGGVDADDGERAEPTESASEAESSEITTAAPVIEAGAVTTGSVEIDGTSIDYVVSVPAGFTPGDEVPLLLAFPPGGQDLGLTQSLVAGTYAPEAQRLGWAVVSPAAPGGELFFNGSETLVPGFLDWVETWVTPEGGAPHVAGVSNGGISTFRYGALNPERVQSMIAFPGFPRSDADQAALAQLVDVPIRMFVGGNDTSWIRPAEDAVATVTDLGGDIELTIFDGEGHVMDSTRDGTVIFELLESFR